MAKVTRKIEKVISSVTGTWLRSAYDWLVRNDCGCCYTPFANDTDWEYCACVGWTDTTGRIEDGKKRFKVAWKIGRQSHINAMQTDLDIDFESPVDPETGMSTGTYILDPPPGTDKAWDREAAKIRGEARYVWRTFGEGSK